MTEFLFGKEKSDHDWRHQHYEDEDALHVVDCESLFVANTFKLFVEGFVLYRINIEHQFVYHICWYYIKSNVWEKLLEELANISRII